MNVFTNSIFWFRQDLRLADNPALIAALEQSEQLTLLYIFEEGGNTRPLGGASRWWLHHSLAALQRDIAALGGQLILKKGEAETILKDEIAAIKGQAIFWNRCYEPESIARDTYLKKTFQANNITVNTFNGSLLTEPFAVQTGDNAPYTVFTPYWKKAKTLEFCAPLPAPLTLVQASKKREGLPLNALDLLPTHPDWAGGLRSIWQVGEQAAQTQLNAFLQNDLVRYKDERDRPDKPSTSRLSPALHFGEVSPRQIWQQTQSHLAAHPEQAATAEKFLNEIGWREFSYNLLYHFPTLPNENLRKNFDSFPWHEDEGALKAWQQGKTGYPIIDAGMRELYSTGWMHNRVRMLVASFLVKDLLIPWQKGEAWFWDTLVDADAASNAASWQWVAGCGADAAPYFRVFNPTLQGQKFDPNGEYVKKWVPELQKLPAPQLHEPWNCSITILREAGITLGKTYPLPLIDHHTARDRALAAFERIKIPR